MISFPGRGADEADGLPNLTNAPRLKEGISGRVTLQENLMRLELAIGISVVVVSNATVATTVADTQG